MIFKVDSYLLIRILQTRKCWPTAAILSKLKAFMLRMRRGGRSPLYSGASGHLTLATIMSNHLNRSTCKFMTLCPGDSGIPLDISRDLNKTLQDHGISKHLIAQVTNFINTLSFCYAIWLGPQVMQTCWGALANTIVIFVENH